MNDLIPFMVSFSLFIIAFSFISQIMESDVDGSEDYKGLPNFIKSVI
jgi:hypothetical protein